MTILIVIEFAAVSAVAAANILFIAANQRPVFGVRTARNRLTSHI